MKRNIASCIVALSVASLSAWQPALSQADAARDRKEALQHYRFGQDALHSERFDIAEQEFQRAAKLDPTLELAPYGLGQVYMATKRYRQAIAAFDKSREVFRANTVIAADDDMAHQRRINDLIKELEDQRRVYDQPGRNASSPSARVYLQQLDSQIKEMKDARNRTTAGADPTPAWISLALGSAYFRSDALAEAERQYRAAIEVDPKLGEAHNNLAVVYLLTGRAPLAETEVAAAEKAGFKVNPQLKEDVKKARQ
jgi:tetratricopeptide (TPR) repeat protein